MTNAEIIQRESERLVEDGVLKMVKVGDDELPEPIHTFNGWKDCGYNQERREKQYQVSHMEIHKP